MDQLKDFSLRLFNILLNNCDESGNADGNQSASIEIDEDFPLECCFCSELFFEVKKFKEHSCDNKIITQSVNRPHKCTFGDCSKAFKKSAELRKHEVRSQNVSN